MSSKEMVRLAYQALEDKQAEDIEVIDISGVTVLADYFIIASGRNPNHVQALVDAVDDTLGRAGYTEHSDEGYRAANWVLMDYRDIVVHIFSKEDRRFYDLERIWRSGSVMSREEILKTEE